MTWVARLHRTVYFRTQWIKAEWTQPDGPSRSITFPFDCVNKSRTSVFEKHALQTRGA